MAQHSDKEPGSTGSPEKEITPPDGLQAFFEEKKKEMLERFQRTLDEMTHSGTCSVKKPPAFPQEQ